MSESQSSTPMTQESVPYQPVSGWAIAGFGIGALFALVVASSTVIALYQGAPVFFPMWTMGIAIAGVLLSLVGQRQVQNSEGTRAGAKLARAGLWLSLLSGLMYFSYYFVTKQALQTQANSFVMEKGDDAGFFPLLREGATNPAQLNAAFLLTQSPNARSGRPEDELRMRKTYGGVRPDGAMSLLTQFRESALVRILYQHLAKDAEIAPLTVQDWRYEKNSYEIYRGYRIKTIEVDYEIVLAVCSVEAETAGQGRKWFVNLEKSKVVSVDLTSLGKGLKRLRNLAREDLGRRVDALRDGEPLPSIKELDQTPWNLLVLEDTKPGELRAQIHQALATGGKKRFDDFKIPTTEDYYGKWEQVQGKVRHHLVLRFQWSKSAKVPPYQADAIAVMESKQAVDPAVPLPDPLEWNLLSISFVSVAKMADPTKGLKPPTPPQPQ